jgi:uncharacterized RDD family membrane protein YckC
MIAAFFILVENNKMEKEFKISKYILATKNERFLHFIIDLVFIYFLSSLIYFLSGFVNFNDKYLYFSDWIDTFGLGENFIFKSIIWFLYYGFTEAFLSRSLAKYFTKTLVVLEDGSKPRLIDILARTTLRLIPFEQYTFLNGRKPGLHDEYSKTFVVKKDKFEESINDFKVLVKIENSI